MHYNSGILPSLHVNLENTVMWLYYQHHLHME